MLGRFLDISRLAAAAICLAPAPALASQSPIDRAEPAVVEEDLRLKADAPRTDAKKLIAAPGQPDSATAGDSVMVGAIRIEGASALPPSAFASVIEAYAGRPLAPSALRALASDVANVARGAGYGLATAWVPRQQVSNAILRVVLDEGRIDAIEAEGDGGAVVRRMLARLADGRPVRTVDLERQLLLAGDVAGIRVGKARLERRDGRNILLVDTRRDRIDGRAAIDNWGSDTVGPVRAQLSANLNGVVADNDRLALGGVLTPLDLGEFGLVRATYSKPIGTNGTEISVGGYYARSHPGAILAGRDIDGRSVEATIGVNHPFVRSRAASLWGDLSFSLRDSESSRADVRIRDDRLATAAATAFANLTLGDARLRGRARLVQGLDLFDATREGDPLASRPDGSGVFSKLELWGSYTIPLAGRLSVQLEAEGQVASRPLLSSEEMGLGGRSFLRGYDYREFSGDKGVAGSAELRFDFAKLPTPLRDGQIYGYADAGSVGNYRSGGGGGTLASVGGGVRVGLGQRITAGLELGFPLMDGHDGQRDPRLSFTLGARF